ncbi:MAG: 5-deoxy-glucuronate isomerase [Actinomycetota bacterium]|nr:5-deoxy-glucuronate isomerase [Actinomycetota bacterium]
MVPDGPWSSQPPHKHDQDNRTHETYLEETGLNVWLIRDPTLIVFLI